MREEYRKKAMASLAAGNSEQAKEHFRKAVDISPAVAQKLIERLREENVEFIVAPFEADAQLAYLSINGLVDAVISEDSDLLTYGCRTVLYKLDKGGQAKEIQASRLSECAQFKDFTFQMFRQTCIFLGCDYLKSLDKFGPKKVLQTMQKCKNYKSVLEHLRNARQDIPSDYEEKFEQAELTFLYQRVWDPINQKIVHLNSPLPHDLFYRDLSFLGEPINDETGFKLAKGFINPSNLFPWKPTSQENPSTCSDPVSSDLPVPEPVLLSPVVTSSSPFLATNSPKLFSRPLHSSLNSINSLTSLTSLTSDNINLKFSHSNRTLKPFQPPRKFNEKESKPDDQSKENQIVPASPQPSETVLVTGTPDTPEKKSAKRKNDDPLDQNCKIAKRNLQEQLNETLNYQLSRSITSSDPNLSVATRQPLGTLGPSTVMKKLNLSDPSVNAPPLTTKTKIAFQRYQENKQRRQATTPKKSILG